MNNFLAPWKWYIKNLIKREVIENENIEYNANFCLFSTKRHIISVYHSIWLKDLFHNQLNCKTATNTI